MKHRKSPTKHVVHSHRREGKVVHSYTRGKGSNASRIVKPTLDLRRELWNRHEAVINDIVSDPDVQRAEIFGSFATAKLNPNDIDMVIFAKGGDWKAYDRLQEKYGHLSGGMGGRLSVLVLAGTEKSDSYYNSLLGESIKKYRGGYNPIILKHSGKATPKIKLMIQLQAIETRAMPSTKGSKKMQEWFEGWESHIKTGKFKKKIHKDEYRRHTRGKNAYAYCQALMDANKKDTLCWYSDCRTCPVLKELHEE